MFEELGRYDDAIRHIRAALAIMNYPVGRQLLGKASYRKWAELQAQGRDAEAEQYFQQGQAASPSLNDVMVYDASTPKGEQLARALVKKGVSINARSADGSTALLLAVNRNFPDAVRFLVAMGADPNITDRRGWTPLLSAADEGQREVVELLLAKGADTKATRENLDAAALAERNGYPEIAAILRKRAAGPKQG
jgi:ankyrin repeat protein